MAIKSQDATAGLAFVGAGLYCAVVGIPRVTPVADVFRAVGFGWVEPAGDLFGGLILLALLVVAAYRLVEAYSLGWPIFKQHDVESLKTALFRLVLYGSLGLVGVGLYGQKLRYVDPGRDLLEVVIAAAFAGVGAGILVLVDEVVSAIWVIVKGRVS